MTTYNESYGKTIVAGTRPSFVELQSNSCTLHNFKIYVPKMCLVFALKINELTYRILFNVCAYNTEQQELK